MEGQLAFPSFTRYQVVRVVEHQDYTKALHVATWQTGMLDKTSRRGGARQSEHERAQATESSAVSSVWKADGVIYLRGEWYHAGVAEGDVVHLCTLSGRYETTVTLDCHVLLHTYPPPGSDPNDDLVLIVHPDMLLQPTIISETGTCSRRAVLKSRMGSSGLTGK